MTTVEPAPQIRTSELIYVEEIMQIVVKAAHPDSSVREVVEKMNRFNIGSIVVVHQKRAGRYIIKRDVLQRVV